MQRLVAQPGKRRLTRGAEPDGTAYMEDWMRLLRMSLIPVLVLVTGFPSLAAAGQQHAVAPGAIAAAVANHAAKQEADRESIREALSRPEVREIAAKAGIDMARVSAAAETIGGSDLERAAEAARQINGSLVGGESSIVLSTTTIIIALLVLILIIVAVN
jgi:hypothetical protein